MKDKRNKAGEHSCSRFCPVPPAFLQSLDLVMVAEQNWKYVESEMKLQAGQICSLLIIHKSEKAHALTSALAERQ